MIAFSLLAQRSSALRPGSASSSHRIQERVRFELGLSYDVGGEYMPLTADLVHVIVVFDATDAELTPGRRGDARGARRARRGRAERRGAGHELDDHRASSCRSGGAGLAPGLLASQYLFGDASPETVSFLAEQEQLTAAEVAAAIASARGS